MRGRFGNFAHYNYHVKLPWGSKLENQEHWTRN